jgi:hypothetical protein
MIDTTSPNHATLHLATLLASKALFHNAENTLKFSHLMVNLQPKQAVKAKKLFLAAIRKGGLFF